MKSKLFRVLVAPLFFLLTTVGVLAEEIEEEDTSKVAIELVTEVETIKPGSTFWIGIAVEAEDGWHTYWKNPGDAGLPTTVEWILPEGFASGKIHWPGPEKFEQDGMVNYGYEGDEEVQGETLLMVPITAPENLEEGQEVEIRANVTWLSCNIDCIPGESEVKTTVIASEAEPVKRKDWQKRFQATYDSWARSLDEWKVMPMVHKGALGILIQPQREGMKEVPGSVYYFSDTDDIEPSGQQKLVESQAGYFLLLPEEKDHEVTFLKGILHNPQGWDKEGKVKNLKVSGKVTNYEETTSSELANMSLLTAIGLAVLGGIILNLMPCVFPILGLKIMGFVQHSKDSNKHAGKLHGLTFSFGVILSFIVLAGTLILLRATGEQLGWGFQLQSPYFISFLALLLTLLGLNFAGVFEVGTSFIAVGGKLQNADGYAGTFFSGVLATVLATPCTAPFMGSALGYALTQPTSYALYIFGALGVGMSLPYLILSFVPRLLSFLPRPGAWMETFKQIMAFPLFATVVWLLWVYGKQTSVDGLTLLLFALLTAGLAAWVYGTIAAPHCSKRRRKIGRSVAVALGLAAALLSYWSTDIHEKERILLSQKKPSDAWEAFDLEEFEEMRKEGKPVFIDFTAAWCLTCQANKRNVLYKERVINKLEDKEITLLQADWTRKDPKITMILNQLGRSGVPTYALYGPGKDSGVKLLPELLTEAIVIEAIEKI